MFSIYSEVFCTCVFFFILEICTSNRARGKEIIMIYIFDAYGNLFMRLFCLFHSGSISFNERTNQRVNDVKGVTKHIYDFQFSILHSRDNTNYFFLLACNFQFYLNSNVYQEN